VAAAMLGTTQQPHGAATNTASRQFQPLVTCALGAAPQQV